MTSNRIFTINAPMHRDVLHNKNWFTTFNVGDVESNIHRSHDQPTI